MARRAQLTLESLKASKPGTPPPVPVNRASALRRGQTLRLPVDSWKQLKKLAAEEEKTSHDLILEALNMLFSERGLPPIA